MKPLRQRIFLVSKRETSTIDGTFFSGGEGKGIGDNSSLLSECQTAIRKGGVSEKLRECGKKLGNFFSWYLLITGFQCVYF